ncbi:AMP-binding protein [Stappia taiwanensis]|uniref:AMP-binding protein n=1 Tax=Stappia taiwanensis TaxID=992267 RepID=A0A838Y4Z3_9HYPH|nr:AMP-binding protein [Stappia taiwanensis]MBA4613910.1 AMP-binding protein [Stappia taiwanensis]GGF07780.1 AMP-dependent synthetase [Stappia taiwanensis]
MSFVGQALPDHARDRPEALALVCGDASLSWEALAARVDALSAAVRGTVAPGGHVALTTTEPVSLLCGFFAVAQAGRVAAVFDPRQFSSGIEETAAELACVLLTEVGSTSIAGHDGAENVPHSEQPFYIGFTSGSSGRPKAFQRSHRSWTESFRLCREAFALAPEDRVFIPGSLGHSLHLFGAVQALDMGSFVEIAPQFHPRQILSRLRDGAATVLYGTPTQLQLLSRAASQIGLTLPGVRRVLVSGSKWRDEQRGGVEDLFPEARLFEFYGTSETSFISYRRSGDGSPAGSVGRPFSDVAVSIRSASGELCSPGVPGAIWIASPLLFDGYALGGEADTCRDGAWLTVGDQGWLDGDGYLHLAGRRSRMLVTAGVNVYAEEIEAVLAARPDVLGVAVFGVPDPVRGTRIVAAIRPTGTAFCGDALRRACLAHLPPIKVPRAFYPMEDWPLTPGGKPDLPALEARVRQRERDDGQTSDPRRRPA